MLVLCCLEAIQKYLKDNLDSKRYQHSLGVAETSVKLAEIYGADKKKAEIAGLIHDCAKNISNKMLIEKALGYNIVLDDILKSSPSLLHGPVGAYVAKEIFDINDEEIFDSVYFHTIGKPNMSLLTKIIYLSDFIEPGRKFPGVEDLRKWAYDDLDKALLLAFDNTLQHIISKSRLIHINTVNARNHLLRNMG